MKISITLHFTDLFHFPVILSKYWKTFFRTEVKYLFIVKSKINYWFLRRFNVIIRQSPKVFTDVLKTHYCKTKRSFSESKMSSNFFIY